MCDDNMVFLGSSQKEVGALYGRVPQSLAQRQTPAEAVEMKRGTPEHPKTSQLASTLKISRREAVGILELLWHFTSRYAPRGDIGKFDDESIARGVFWDADPGVLVQALITSRWLERFPDPSIRLIIHDWEDHADDYTRKQLKRKGLSFVGNCPETVRTFLDSSLEKTGSEGAPALPCLALPVPASTAASNGRQSLPQISTEYPLTIAEIRKHDAAVDDFFVARLAKAVTQHCISHSKFPQEKLHLVTDKAIAKACRESYSTGPPQHGTGLLLSRVPSIIVTWAVEKSDA